MPTVLPAATEAKYSPWSFVTVLVPPGRAASVVRVEETTARVWKVHFAQPDASCFFTEWPECEGTATRVPSYALRNGRACQSRVCPGAGRTTARGAM